MALGLYTNDKYRTRNPPDVRLQQVRFSVVRSGVAFLVRVHGDDGCLYDCLGIYLLPLDSLVL